MTEIMPRIIKTIKFFLFTLIIMVFSITISEAEVRNDNQIPAEKIDQFVDIYKRIKEQYVDDIDDVDLFNYAIKGMVTGLDPHSSFLSSDDFNELKRVSNCVHQSQENKYKSIIDGINQSEGIITNLQGNNTTHFQGNNTGMRMIVERFQNKDSLSKNIH